MGPAGGGGRGERLGAHGWPGGFADSVGQGDQVIGGRRGRLELAVEADQLPAAGGGEAARVGLAQVVGVRLRVDGQRAHDSGGLGIDIGQRGNSLPWAAISGASPWRPHGE